ncbi:sulfatase-like hydrolase/transferase [Halosolutus gelatinilyticus]|uniref:sulfatase-like hydrolase/transferase n=1 Tax=Halosolutus gelatinilyticus TaxID=2931975 RepID=UPI003CE54526
MSDHPNVVFLVLNTLQRDRVPLYNDDVTFTENLEALGSESVVFTDAVAQAPWPLPSHASMFTGTYPWEHGATQQSPIFESATVTPVGRVADAGYQTTGFSPNPWVSSFTGLTTGFDTWDDFLTPRRFSLPEFVASSRILEWWSNQRFERLKGTLTDLADSLFEAWSRYQDTDAAQSKWVVEQVQAFLEDRNRFCPFFLYIILLDIHKPYYLSDPYRQRHAPDVASQEECQITFQYLKADITADFESYTAGAPVAKDGYGFLDLATRQLPATHRDRYYKQFRYVVNEFWRVVRAKSESEPASATSAVRRELGRKRSRIERLCARSRPTRTANAIRLTSRIPLKTALRNLTICSVCINEGVISVSDLCLQRVENRSLTGLGGGCVSCSAAK